MEFLVDVSPLTEMEAKERLRVKIWERSHTPLLLFFLFLLHFVRNEEVALGCGGFVSTSPALK